MTTYARLQAITDFKVPMAQRQKNEFLFVLDNIYNLYENISPLCLNGLRSIHVTDNKDKELNKDGFLGVCDFNIHEIRVVFYDEPQWDSALDSHELAHEACNEIYKNPKDANNLVHYAANAGWINYFYVKYPGSWLEYVHIRKQSTLAIAYIDLGKLRANADKIRTEIANGTAPKGSLGYV